MRLCSAINAAERDEFEIKSVPFDDAFSFYDLAQLA